VTSRLRIAALVAVCLASARAHAGDIAALCKAAPRLSPRVLDLALRAATCARRRGLVERPELLTVIDYSRPSTEPRLWVLDLARSEVAYEELVAHGRGSGENDAVRFTNAPGSHASSLGLYVTGDTYVGQHGRSLRLAGLEPGVNDRAGERLIVMHGADYVSRAFAATHGRLGRSWGCPAVDPKIAHHLIDRIQAGTPLFIYYPDERWLRTSPFLGGCDDAAAAS
jgi:hypothetical protein